MAEIDPDNRGGGPRYVPTVTLGNILSMVAIVVTMIGGFIAAYNGVQREMYANREIVLRADAEAASRLTMLEASRDRNEVFQRDVQRELKDIVKLIDDIRVQIVVIVRQHNNSNKLEPPT